jgi:hypothetical protein
MEGTVKRKWQMLIGSAMAILVFIIAGSYLPLRSQDWEAEGQKKADALKKKNGSGTELKLQKRLLEMKEEDQAIRHKAFDDPVDNVKKDELFKDMEAVDRKLTAELKEIVQKYGWPTIRLVGMQASQAATLILNHSPDHDFQRELLPKLSKMVEQDEIVGSDLGPIIDKLLLSEGKPQLLGSVFRFEGEFMIMEPVEDPEHLDQRRTQYLLPPMKEYIKTMEDIYHKKVK